MLKEALSIPATRVALDVIDRMKLADAHRGCNPKKCDVAGENLHHCEHGQYVGSWAGPDHMCGYCEEGTSRYEYALDVAYRHQRRHLREVRQRVVKAAITEMVANPDEAAWLSTNAVGELTHLIMSIGGGRWPV